MITEVKLLYAPFKRFFSGHVCLIFTLADGTEVVISPEARTDNFILLLGFLPFYSLRYSKLEYSEYVKKYQVASRTFNSVKLEIEPERALSLYEEMSERISYLEKNEERYHILSNSCITNTLRHLKNSAQFDLSIAQTVKLYFNPHELGTFRTKAVFSK